jgi:WG containing repeat
MKKFPIVAIELLNMAAVVLILPLLQSCVTSAVGPQYKYIDKAGHECAFGPFVHATDFSDGLACVQGARGFGFIDHTGKFVVEPQLGTAHKFSEGLAGATKPGEHKYGFIDKTGNWIIPPQYMEVGDFSGGLAWVGIATPLLDSSGRQWGRKCGYIDKGGQFVFTINGATSEEASRLLASADSCEFSDGLAPFLKLPENRWGYIDKTGKFLIEPKFEEVFSFVNHFARVKTSDGIRFINQKGQFIGPAFSEARDFSDGMAPVRQDESSGKWGYVDSTGRLAIKPQFDDVGKFSEGCAEVRMYVPKTNTNTSTGNAPDAKGDFMRSSLASSAGLVMTSKTDSKTWVIDKTGKKIDIDLGPEGSTDLKSEFFANQFSEGLLGVRRGKFAGFVDKTGSMVVPAKWRAIGNFHEGLAHVLP